MYICILRSLKLAQVRKVAPKLGLQAQHTLNADTVQAIIHNRYLLAMRYSKQLHSDLAAEMAKIKHDITLPDPAKAFAKWLQKEPALLNAVEQQQLQVLTAQSPMLDKIYRMRRDLSELWGRSSLSSEELVQKLQAWCQQAENSGIEALARYAQVLRQAKTIQAA